MEKISENTTTAYQQKVRAQLKEMKAQMLVLQAKAEQSGADMRLKYQKRIDEMNTRMREINNRLENISNSAEGAWEDIKGGIDRSMQELKNSVDGAIKQFNQ